MRRNGAVKVSPMKKLLAQYKGTVPQVDQNTACDNVLRIIFNRPDIVFFAPTRFSHHRVLVTTLVCRGNNYTPRHRKNNRVSGAGIIRSFNRRGSSIGGRQERRRKKYGVQNYCKKNKKQKPAVPSVSAGAGFFRYMMLYKKT